MKKIIILLCLFPLAGMAQDKFEISGTLSAVGTGRTVLLQYRNSDGKDAADSTKVKNGKFVLRGATTLNSKAMISLLPLTNKSNRPGAKRDEQVFFLERGKYTLIGRDSIAKATLTGAASQKEYLEYRRQIEKPSAESMVTLEKFMAAFDAKDSVEMNKIRPKLTALNNRMDALRDSFIFSHPDSYVSLDMVANQIAVIENPKYYTAMSKRVLSSVVGKKLTDRMVKSRLIALGKSIDFTQPDDKGKAFTLSSLKGKYVLVDFWASWCGPCRYETPFLLRAYRTLKDKNFEIVSISLDEKKEAWLKAITDDSMPWIQVSDLKGFKNEVAHRFAIISIPQNVLVDPNGVIIAKNLRGEDITERISALIK